jgi:cell division inhibitor SepF
MSALRKMGVYLGLVEDGERYGSRDDDAFETDEDLDYDGDAQDDDEHDDPSARSANCRIGVVSQLPRRSRCPASPLCTRARTTRHG